MHPTCSECAAPMPGADPRRITCSDACRHRRSRRLRRERAQRLIAAAQRGEVDLDALLALLP